MKANLYSDFEEAFRGTRAEIIQRLSGYEGLLAEYAKQTEPQALDIGCGRGEWLQLLERQDFAATGVDSNPYFVEQCQALGLQAICADAFDYLQTIPDRTYCLVSAFHLIEHLNHAQIITLLSELLRILRPGGLLLVETPSIDNLLVASKSFYSDPTHTTPIHPEALCFLLKQIGFDWSTILYINGGVEAEAPHNRIQRIFNGVAQDVCILASPHVPEESFREGRQWRRTLNHSPTTLEAVYQYHQASSDTLRELQDRLNSNEARLANINLLLSRLRWWLHPLLVLRRQMRRLVAACRQPRSKLKLFVHATGLTSRRHRRMLSTLLKRFRLYYVSLALYQRVNKPTPASQSYMLSRPARSQCMARANQIETDLARLRKRGTRK